MKTLSRAILIFSFMTCGLLQAQVQAQAQTTEALARTSGCFKCHGVEESIVGPAFREIAARYDPDPSGFDLAFMAVPSPRDLPEKRKSLVIVAQTEAGLHIRAFDGGGVKVIDQGEAGFVKGDALTNLKSRWTGPRLPQGGTMSAEEKRKTVEQALAAAGRARSTARDRLVEVIKRGGKGKWLAVSKGSPMPPFEGRLSEEQIRQLADWVLRRSSTVELKVMNMGLGSGTVTSNPAGIQCGGDCDETFASPVTVTLTASPSPGSVFARWEGDASGQPNPCTVTMSENRYVRAVFDLNPAIPPLADCTPTGIRDYLTAYPAVNAPARFLSALPEEFKQNWILMTRSESLQTGTAESPRLLLPSANARAVFTIGMTTHASYPGSHPNAVEYMQWDAGQKNFRFHEIVLDEIAPMGVFPKRDRGVSVDDPKCFNCHSTRNVLNRSMHPGTTGIPPGTVKAKSKPNWDAYDSWGGMTPFNRDRIHQGSVEAAAFRRIFNLWNWRTNDPVRGVIEQLRLQPPNVASDDAITRTNGGPFDGHINFAFDDPPPVTTEPPPVGDLPPIMTNYSFDRQEGSGTLTTVERGGDYVTLRHSGDASTPDRFAEGRGVQLFDLLGGLDGQPNAERIADELVSHRFATGSAPIDVRPIALAITKGLIRINPMLDQVESTPPLNVTLGFFDARNGMRINALLEETKRRAESVPRRKADIQKINLDRTNDPYVFLGPGGAANGLLQQYGAATSGGADVSLDRIRKEVFRRPIDLGDPDLTVMGGIYVDREKYILNSEPIALFRYFLEPLGVSVDKWSMGVRGRSRTYSFADVYYPNYTRVFEDELKASLLREPVPGLTNPDNDAQLIAAVNSTLSALPGADDVPKYTDIQRIFNKSCIECHGGLDYPPYSNYGTFLDFSENETPASGSTRLRRSYQRALSQTTPNPATSDIYLRITDTNEDCPDGMMPCGGPALSKADIETIRRWIAGGRPFTVGDPHIKTIDGVGYDFQAAGEFVFLRGEDMEIQVRQTAVPTAAPLADPHLGLASCVSVNTAVALRIRGHRITYQPRLDGEPDPKGLQLRVDGKLREMTDRGIPLSQGVRIVSTIAPGGLQVEEPGGTVVIITPGWWEHRQLWYLNIDGRHVRATEGLMGTVAPGNWLPALPDGRLMGPRPQDLRQRRNDLYRKFGAAWRVSDAASLFDYAPGSSTKTFTLEHWPGDAGGEDCELPQGPGMPAPRPPQEPMTAEAAKQLAADIVDPDLRANCIKDLMATGERGFARTYLLTDRIARNAPPSPPLLAFPKNFEKDLTPDVAFVWSKSADSDGDALTYRHYVWPVNQAPDVNAAEPVPAPPPDSRMMSKAVSRLEPGKAYFWKVIVEDGKGGVTESATRRFQVK